MNALGLHPAPIAAVRRALARAFRVAGIESPDLDARVLVGHALGLDHTGLAAQSDRYLTKQETECIAALATRRLRREPVACIVAIKEFWGLPLRITSAVLVPRPDTETLVAAVLAIVDAERSRSRPLRIADLGTGSGALLLALLSEIDAAIGIGTDSSVAALELARDNAERLQLSGRARFVGCHYGAALRGPFDLVVANPPYVTSAGLALLPPEVREHEPRLALDGGIDGLAGYHAIAADALRLLSPIGHMVVELGAGQAAEVASLFLAAGLAVASPVATDLGGIERALHFRPMNAARPLSKGW
jgi:release factor glutamine methyltransferase